MSDPAEALDQPSAETQQDHQRDLRFRARGRIIRADEVETWDTAQSYLDAAKREARRLRMEASEAFAREKRRGFEEGRQEGAEAAARLLMETRVKADRHLAAADGQIVDLAMAVVARVLGDLDVKEIMLRAVQHALVSNRRDQPLTLHVAPELVDDLRRQIDDGFGDAGAQLITVEADPRLEIDECRAASDIGFVELGLEAQIRALHQGLRDGLKQADRG